MSRNAVDLEMRDIQISSDPRSHAVGAQEQVVGTSPLRHFAHFD